MLAALTGCGLRTEDDAPRLPFLPGREPLPGETLLLTLLDSCGRSAYRGAPKDVDATGILATQRTVLRDALLRAGVPTDVVDAPVEAGHDAPPADTQAGAELVVRCLEVARDDFLPLLGALSAQRIAATTWAGSDQTWPTPSRAAWATEQATVAGDAWQATQSAVWTLQYVAAHVTGATRTKVTSTLRALWTLQQDMLAAAGEHAPAPQLGQKPPATSPSAAKAAELADTALRRLREQLADGFADLAADRARAFQLATWLATAELQAHRWATPLTAFPGLKTPA